MYFSILSPYAQAVHANPKAGFAFLFLIGYIFVESEDAMHEMHWLPRKLLTRKRKRYYLGMIVLNTATFLLILFFAQCFFQRF